MEVNYEDIQLFPVFNTVRHEEMTDDVYFSESFSKGYISKLFTISSLFISKL